MEEEIARDLASGAAPTGGPEPEHDEKELVLSFQAGDAAAYDRIYRLYCERVRRLCRRMLVRREDADEAAQEAFLRVYLALPRFNGRYQLGSWITRIATNVCLDRIRASARRPVDPAALPELESALVEAVDSDPEVQTLRNAESRRVTRVLLRLPATHRAAIVLRDLEGMSYAEVAQTLGLTEVQTKALIHRARQSFKRSWTSAVSAILPARLVHRLREGTDSLRNQVAEMVAPASQAASHCSLLVQQCGNYFVDKAASLGTAAVVIGGSAALAATGTPPFEPPAAPATRAPGGSGFEAAAPERPLADPDEDGSSPTQVVEPPPVEPSAPPTAGPSAEPTASPAPTGEPEPSPSPSAEPSATPKPSASPSPTPPASALPMTDIRFEQGQPAGMRAATGGRSSADCGTRKVTQTLDVQVSTGRGLYQGRLSFTLNGSSGFELDVFDGSYSVHYVGGGPIDRIEALPDGGLRFLSSGMFGSGSGHAAGLGLPESGRFSVDLTLDCASNSVVTETLAFQR